jgi:NADH:ubiquinone oxidoreductase subunit 3 (subunit A)
MIFIRVALICLVVYLITRSLVQYGAAEQQKSSQRDSGKKDKSQSKKISKNVGEYVDYEELKK